MAIMRYNCRGHFSHCNTNRAPSSPNHVHRYPSFPSNGELRSRCIKRKSHAATEQDMLSLLRGDLQKRFLIGEVWHAAVDIVVPEFPCLSKQYTQWTSMKKRRFSTKNSDTQVDSELKLRTCSVQEDAQMEIETALEIPQVVSEQTKALTESLTKQALVWSVWKTRKASVTKETREMGTQCDLEDMLEPMATHPVHNRMCARRVRKMELEPEVQAPSSIVEFHFISFRDLGAVTQWASMLSQQELEELACGFLGTRIAGIAVRQVESKNDINLRRVVTGRFLDEAVALARIPNFRAALFSSCIRLFFQGFSQFPFNGRSLFELVEHHATQWTSSMHTALDFACRLIENRVLPQALKAELLHRSSKLQNEVEVLHTIHMVSIVSACRPTADTLPLARSTSCQYPNAQTPSNSCLSRTRSSPAKLCPVTRSKGTLLRLQDDLVTACRVTFEGVTKDKVIAETIPLEIPLKDLPDYWRFAAGGEHKDKTRLERHALKAEEEIREFFHAEKY